MRTAWRRRSVSIQLSAAIGAIAACAQCPDLADSTTGWPSGSDIVAYFLSNALLGGEFSGAQANAVCCSYETSGGSAFYNWNTTLGSGLNLTQEIEDSLDGLPSTNYFLIAYGSTTGCGESKAACTNWYTNAENQISYATTYVTSSAPGSSSWLELMAHEIPRWPPKTGHWWPPENRPMR